MELSKNHRIFNSLVKELLEINSCLQKESFKGEAGVFPPSEGYYAVIEKYVETVKQILKSTET